MIDNTDRKEINNCTAIIAVALLQPAGPWSLSVNIGTARAGVLFICLYHISNCVVWYR